MLNSEFQNEPPRADKPGAIIGASTGQIGATVAQQHLRVILSPLKMLLMGQPEAYIQLKPGMIDDAYRVTDEGLLVSCVIFAPTMLRGR